MLTRDQDGLKARNLIERRRGLSPHLDEHIVRSGAILPMSGKILSIGEFQLELTPLSSK
jgi:hypothetical protein